MKKTFCLIFALTFIVIPFNKGESTSYDYDLGINSKDIFFNKPIDELVEKQPVRIYAGIRNYGNKDVSASVIFLNGATVIKESQVVSVRAGGAVDEVYVDWIVPSGTFNILAQIKNQDPQDQNPSNDSALTKLITPLKDTDGDSLPDIKDPDDDNDGVPDDLEIVNNTDPLLIDSDNDGVNDKDDVYPTDPTKSKLVVVTSPPVVTPEPVIDQVTNLMEVKKEVTETVTPKPSVKQVKNSKPEPVVEEKKIEYTTEAFQELQTMPGFELLSEVQIDKKELGWGRYNFSFTTNVPDIQPNDLIFEWDFGDGVTSKVNGEHKFLRSGTYYVKLRVVGPWGNNISDVEIVNVPFWSIGNLTMWGCVVFLLISLLVLIFIGRGKKDMIGELKEKK